MQATDRPALRVLIVDDDEGLLRALEQAFSRSGLIPVTHLTFASAREALRTGPFDGLVTDVRLGAFNGLQLAIAARELHPHLRIIVFSGFDDPVLRSEAEQLGASFYAKPVLASVLVRDLLKQTPAD